MACAYVYNLRFNTLNFKLDSQRYNIEVNECTGAEKVGRKTRAGLIDGMSGAKRGRSDTPVNDRQNPG